MPIERCGGLRNYFTAYENEDTYYNRYLLSTASNTPVKPYAEENFAFNEPCLKVILQFRPEEE
jgi:hypothetical protein